MKELAKRKIPAKRMNPKLTFGDITNRDRLAHAHHLAVGILGFLKERPIRWGKVNRHLGSLQTLLSVAKWHTLEELMDLNRPA